MPRCWLLLGRKYEVIYELQDAILVCEFQFKLWRDLVFFSLYFSLSNLLPLSSLCSLLDSAVRSCQIFKLILVEAHASVVEVRQVTTQVLERANDVFSHAIASRIHIIMYGGTQHAHIIFLFSHSQIKNVHILSPLEKVTERLANMSFKKH